MESRAFIKHAGELIAKIELAQNTIGTAVELHAQREAVQKEVTALFVGLQNPTLPSAFRLRDTAFRNGYTVPRVALERLSQFE